VFEHSPLYLYGFCWMGPRLHWHIPSVDNNIHIEFKFDNHNDDGLDNHNGNKNNFHHDINDYQ